MQKIIVTFLFLFSLNSFAGQERGGGSNIELEFVKVANIAYGAINGAIQHGNHLFDGFNLTDFNQAIGSVEIYGLDKVCEPNSIDTATGSIIPGRCLDAQYLPELNRIEFDTNIWKAKTCMQKVSLVTHEYGRASGNEDGNYKYSSRMDQIDELSQECDEYDRELAAQQQANAKHKNGVYKVLLPSDSSTSAVYKFYH